MMNISKLTLKRLQGDFKLLKKDPHEYFEAYPDDKDVLIWYFIVKGPDFSDFKDGYYLGKIMHNPEYPLKAPDFMILTPNGRFIEDKKICLSNSSYHSSEWSAMWNIKAILTGFLSIMLDDNENGISHIHISKEERQILAKKSIEYNKQHFPDIIKKFTRFLDEKGDPKVNNIIQQNDAKQEESKSTDKSTDAELKDNNIKTDEIQIIDEAIEKSVEPKKSKSTKTRSIKSKLKTKSMNKPVKKATSKTKTDDDKIMDELAKILE